MTYAAGLQAVMIIWLAAHYSEEHRATLDWLNTITEGNFHFVGVEVALLTIGNSLAAPRFTIVSKDNDWPKSVSRAARQIDEEAMTETKAQQLRYWNALNNALGESGFRNLTVRKPGGTPTKRRRSSGLRRSVAWHMSS